MREKLFSVLGPYRERKKWRLVVFEGEARKSMFADSADEALRLKESLLHLRDNPPERPLCAALNDYLAEKQAAGLHATSLRKLQAQLRAFLPQEIRLGELTAQGAAELYRDETLRVGRFGKIHAATHHLLLRSCKAFFEWAVTRGYLAANPFRAVKPIGKAKRGKPQLREDEARKLSALLLSAASQGEEAALALSVQLLMALRSAEVLALRVRDVDSSGWKLVVEGTKTANARRALPVKSEPLRLLLLRRCTGRKPDDLLFGTGRGRPYCTDFLWDNLRRYCVAAAVPIVCRTACADSTPRSLCGMEPR